MRALVAIAVVLALSACSPDTQGVTVERIVALSDGDHAASTYIDGRLGDAGHRDQLSTVSVLDGVVRTAHVDVPNSVTAAPEVLALSPDGGTAFVAERLAQRRPGDTTASQLGVGRTVTAVDIRDLATPTVIASTAVGDSPEALAVSPDGRQIAVVTNPPRAAVVELIGWAGDRFTTSVRAPLADGALATNVQWHPNGKALAVNVDNRDRVEFHTVEQRPDGSHGLRPWGQPVPVGRDPFVGRFTPDGKHYLTANWGRDLSTTVAAQRLPRTRSTLSVIEVDDGGQHRVVDTDETDKSSEGLAVSPDGRLVATVNMRGTAFPPASPLHDGEASVSLLRLDPGSGALTKIGDYPLPAVLPEGGTFDRSGGYFIATSFERDPGLLVYRVDDVGLTPVQRIPLPHGVHHVVVG